MLNTSSRQSTSRWTQHDAGEWRVQLLFIYKGSSRRTPLLPAQGLGGGPVLEKGGLG